MSKARQLADLGNVYDDGALSNRNMVTNGSMIVAQRGSSFSLASNTYTLDRWNMDTYSISGIAGTVSQDTSVVPEGHTSSLKVSVTTGGTISAGGYFSIQQFMEGYQVTSLDLGKSTAKDFTISFWVRSSVTGTFGIALRDGGFGNSYGTTYTINSADTWEYKTVTITGPTSGTFSTTNSYGLNVIWSLGADSAVTTSSNNAWASGSKVAAFGQTNSVATTTGATFYLTGVQLEVGDTATPFEHRSFHQELQACKRYFCKSYGYDVAIGSATGQGAIYTRNYDAVANRPAAVRFPVEMRATPTITCYNTNNDTADRVSDCGSNYAHVTGVTVNTVERPTSTGFGGLNLATAIDEIMGFHYVAEAEL